MPCNLCGQRKGRRFCPALSRQICPVCCATKRGGEIRCPSTCAYLSSAREHPAAAVRRQRTHDLSVLLPVLRTLTHDQQQLFFVLVAAIGRHKPEAFQRLTDDDVAEAAGALAQTLEASSRGVIYEQQTASLPAQRLLVELKKFVASIGGKGGTAFEREAASSIRAIEHAARIVREDAGQSGDSFLGLAERIARQLGEPAAPTSDAAPAVSSSPLIVP